MYMYKSLKAHIVLVKTMYKQVLLIFRKLLLSEIKLPFDCNKENPQQDI